MIRFLFLHGMALVWGYWAAEGQMPGRVVQELILSEQGDLPVLLAAPHGGSMPIPDVPERTTGVLVQDSNTLELAQEVSQELAKFNRKRKPYLVAARFDRKYTDANRSLAEALESLRARPVYEAYHERLREYVGEIRERFGGEGLLLDLHGQAREEEVIFRGTGNGQTVMRLLERHGEEAFTGPESVLGWLAGRGYAIVPPNTPPRFPPEDPSYNGGYTVRTYGSHREEGIDAIQLEVGMGWRRTKRERERFARDLAEAVQQYAEKYLVRVE